MQPPSNSDDPASWIAGNLGGSQEPPAAGYTLQEAAGLLGVSINTVRRRLEAGEITGQKVHRPQGYAWRVYLNVERAPANQQAEQEAASRLQEPPTSMQPVAAVATLLAPLLEQAIRPLVEQIGAMSDQLTAQAEELGQLRAELARARETIQTLQTTATADAVQQPTTASPAAQEGHIAATLSESRPVQPESTPPQRAWWAFWR